jgi:hypothetical protein
VQGFGYAARDQQECNHGQWAQDDFHFRTLPCLISLHGQSRRQITMWRHRMVRLKAWPIAGPMIAF